MNQSQIITLKSEIFLSARMLRRTVRRIRQSQRFGSLAGAPVLFANSFPKSGTHLLTQVMQGFTHIGPAVDSGLPAIVTFRGDTGSQRPEEEILGDFRRLLPGDVSYGHVHALPAAIAFLRQDSIAPFFILRDPRDVVVSHVHYLAEMAPSHIHHHYFNQVMGSFEERLQASIVGVSAEQLGNTALPLPDIRRRFEPYMDWLKYPEILTLRYEDFITQRETAIGQVFDHAVQRGFKSACDRDQAIQTLADSINPSKSPTFRSGKIGGWRAAFTEEHKQIFKEVAGDLLLRLGYEQSSDW